MIIEILIIENDRKSPINVKIIWPALILAAIRIAKVKGCTLILIISIRGKKGIKNDGVPEGKREAKDE